MTEGGNEVTTDGGEKSQVLKLPGGGRKKGWKNVGEGGEGGGKS
jgi:hypothetical protein